MVLEKIPTFDEVKAWVNSNTVSDHSELSGVTEFAHHQPFYRQDDAPTGAIEGAEWVTEVDGSGNDTVSRYHYNAGDDVWELDSAVGASEPTLGTPVAGATWRDTTGEGTPKQYDGTAFVSLGKSAEDHGAVLGVFSDDGEFSQSYYNSQTLPANSTLTATISGFSSDETNTTRTKLGTVMIATFTCSPAGDVEVRINGTTERRGSWDDGTAPSSISWDANDYDTPQDVEIISYDDFDRTISLSSRQDRVTRDAVRLQPYTL